MFLKNLFIPFNNQGIINYILSQKLIGSWLVPVPAKLQNTRPIYLHKNNLYCILTLFLAPSFVQPIPSPFIQGKDNVRSLLPPDNVSFPKRAWITRGKVFCLIFDDNAENNHFYQKQPWKWLRHVQSFIIYFRSAGTRIRGLLSWRIVSGVSKSVSNKFCEKVWRTVTKLAWTVHNKSAFKEYHSFITSNMLQYLIPLVILSSSKLEGIFCFENDFGQMMCSSEFKWF